MTDKRQQRREDREAEEYFGTTLPGVDFTGMMATVRAMAGIGDGEDQKVLERVGIRTGLKRAMEVCDLDPAAVGAIADADLRRDIAHDFPRLRAWMDRVERALPPGLHVVR